ncbi:hypothetical protein ZIOFF_047396 [Zingiber officinale]|uniref:UBC core domain-containing protein n=1 Tax=Zingiber officinale TaxID=94328 RepID=A0A8J5FMW9_ZINOF|nr:hypothetical protein ZIOFF_047396 [Zingiber officinale]
MSTPARKRLMRDFKRLQQDPPAGISGAPHDNNIMLWNAVIFGPDDTPWDGGVLIVEKDGITHPKGTCWICLYEVLATSGCTKESYVGCDHWMRMGVVELRLPASHGSSCVRRALNCLIGQGKDVRIAQLSACTFKLTLQVSEDYPNKPPTVRFVSRMFHPNIYADGSICLDILQNQWSPIYDVAAILTSIQSLLCDPNPNSPANSEAARMFSENKREYNRKVREIVEQSWTAD